MSEQTFAVSPGITRLVLAQMTCDPLETNKPGSESTRQSRGGKYLDALIQNTLCHAHSRLS